MIIRKRSRCRVCDETLLEDSVLIGEQYPSAVYLDDVASYKSKLHASSLNVAKCSNEDCSLVQLSHEYDLSFVFEHYPYVSSTTATMNNILKSIVEDALNECEIREGDTILDIGGNDGSLLKLIPTRENELVNFDAAKGINSVIDSDNYLKINGLFDSERYKSYGLKNPKLIFSVAMFYHLNNPKDFCRKVESIMNIDTVWCIQMTYLGTMLVDNIYDNIVHEHVTYFSLKSLRYLLLSVGLDITKASIVPSYGGSLRVFVMKKAVVTKNSLSEVLKFEEFHKTNLLQTLEHFNTRVHTINKIFRETAIHLFSKYGKLSAIGASTKGNMILQFAKLNREYLDHILDNNEKKIGHYTAGTEVKIVDESEYISKIPEYLLVLPYYYVDHFINIIKEKLEKGRTIYLLVPLPTPHFIPVTG